MITISDHRLKMVSLIIVSILLMPLLGWGANFYVDATNGQDTNPGTLQLPLKTISAAVTKAFPGDTAWVSSGTYREMITLRRGGSSAENPITLRAMPGADVNIKGSDLVSGWIPHSGPIWKRTNWDINSQQVFVNGLPLQQIGRNCPFNSQTYGGNPILPSVGLGLSDMIPGSFWYDPSPKTLYVWLPDHSDPNLHQIEASVRNWIIPPGDMFNFIRLYDLKFSHSNQTVEGYVMGLVNVWGSFWTVSGCTFTYGDFSGIHIVGEGHEILNNTSNFNGSVGMSFNGSDAVHSWKAYPNRPPQNIRFEGNETNYNNYRRFNPYWYAGGIHGVTSCNTILIRKHKAHGNSGHGIWIDGWGRNIVIDRSVATNSLGAGIVYEISDDGILSNNLVAHNSEQGIYVAASSGVKVLNNTVVKNWAGIVLHGMPRAERPTLSNNMIRNNIIQDSLWADLVMYANPSDAINNTSDFNLYFRFDGTVRISWTSHPGYDVNYLNLLSFKEGAGQESHSLSGNPLWTNEMNGDYSLQSGSPAVDSGTDSFAEVGDRDLKGLPRISDGNQDGIASIDMGAFELQPPMILLPPQNFRRAK